MQNIMTVAWRLARKGQKKFGGKVSEYLSEALKMAWEMVGKNIKRVSKKVRIAISAGSRNHKSWVAQITGTHPTYKLNRSFVDSVDHNMSERHFDLMDGVYEVCDAGSRQFIQISKGNVEVVEYSEVMELVA